jgi:4-amino-4-deoxy-L-arabinose transferase-like glycosyltransferase
LLVAMASTMFLFGLGADWHDGLDAEGPQVIQEMLRGEGWVLPLHNGRRIPLKPPLFHWLGALSATLRGTDVDLIDPRLPSALLGTLCVVLVYLFARWQADESVALWAGLILLTTPQFVIEARNSRVDMVLCLFLTAALLLAYRVWRGGGGRPAALGAGLCLGLAALTKGPLALALFALLFMAAAFTAPPSFGWRALLSPAVLALALGLPLAWYAAAAWHSTART